MLAQLRTELLKDRRVLIIVAAPHGTTLPMRILKTPRKNQYLAMTVAQKETIRRHQLKIREDTRQLQLKTNLISLLPGCQMAKVDDKYVLPDTCFQMEGR